MIRAASLRPAEGEQRVFVIEEAEDLRDESQNALLKTLEEPAPFAHLILLCAEPELLAGTILSRCREVEFAPLPPDAVLEALGESGAEAEAAARLCAGDLRLAEAAADRPRRALRASAELAARAAAAATGRGPSPGARCSSPPRRPATGAAAEEERGCWRTAAAGLERGRSAGKLTREAHRPGEADRAAGPHRGPGPGPGAVLRLVPRPGGGRRGRGERRAQLRPRDELADDAEGLDPGRGPGRR